jgi:hypothetical protein
MIIMHKQIDVFEPSSYNFFAEPDYVSLAIT